MDFRKKNFTKESLDMVAVGGWIRMVSMDLNAEASGRGTISEGSGGVALLKDVCHWGGL